MRIGTIYIITNDIEKSIDFYTKLLQQEPIYRNENRWVQFSNFIALYNPAYDKSVIPAMANENFNQAYIDDVNTDRGEAKNNTVVVNFIVDDLGSEYRRLKELNIGKVSDLMYLNVFIPYWYFNITDPDGNIIEITGKYDAE